MEVTLLHNTPLEIANIAIGKCWDKPMEMGEKACGRIERVANKNKHASTIEHLSYSFDIDGISRACLQELARHRHASMSVKSTRYTLKELKNEPLSFRNYDGDESITPIFYKYCVSTGDDWLDVYNVTVLEGLQHILKDGVSNDIAKYCLPESYKTSLVWTINARALQNFISLRTDRAALWEIRELAYTIYDKLPEDHKFLFKEYVKERD